MLFDMIERFDNSAVLEREQLLAKLEMEKVAKLQTDIMTLRKWKETIHLVYQEALAYERENVDAKFLFDVVEVNDTKTEPIDEGGELEITGDSVGRIILFNKVYENIAASKVLPLVTEVIISKMPFDVVNFPKTVTLNLNKKNFSYDKAEIKSKPEKLTNGMYVELDNTLEDVRLICCAMVTICGFGADEIKFE